ncbi:hypothetical protein [Falsiroseomonas sp. CW058]|uniref:hypothetical protein n=1 Tax=Falsiroseomonas sp. CW058 TaxID=3388664 RepID=UPI003D3155BD
MPLVVDSVTHLTPDARGKVALCASHGGTYAAWHAARHGLAAMILHDAGIGRERAGIGGLDWLEARGIPGACVGHESARIGDAADMLRRGVLTFANAAAARCGVEPGMTAARALGLLEAAARPAADVADGMHEAGREVAGRGGVRVFALDSNGMVGPEHAGQVVVTGSHGGLLGGRPGTAVKAQVAAALYNDAGVGIDRAGLSRLPALDARGIPAGCVSCFSARIGDGLSTWEDGFLSAVNATAAVRGGRIGQSARDFVAAMLEHA